MNTVHLPGNLLKRVVVFGVNTDEKCRCEMFSWLFSNHSIHSRTQVRRRKTSADDTEPVAELQEELQCQVRELGQLCGRK